MGGLVIEVAWATTHFNPTLEIRIIGLSIQEEETLKSFSTKSVPFLLLRISMFVGI